MAFLLDASAVAELAESVMNESSEWVIWRPNAGASSSANRV